MNEFDWSSDKNTKLIANRGISFEEFVEAISKDGLLDDIEHHRDRFEHQKILVVRIENYAYMVPYVEQDDGIMFLKIAYLSREATKKYIA